VGFIVVQKSTIVVQFLSDFIALHNKFYSLQPIRLCNGCAILQKEERKSLKINDLRS